MRIILNTGSDPDLLEMKISNDDTVVEFTFFKDQATEVSELLAEAADAIKVHFMPKMFAIEGSHA